MRPSRPLHLLPLFLLLGCWPWVSEAQDDGGELLTIEVVEAESGKPVGVDLRIQTNVEGWEDATDEQGICEIDLPAAEEFQFLRVSTERDGYVAASRTWQRGRDGKLPEVFRIEVERGTRVGGIVKNDEGQPVEGVTVDFSFETEGQSRGSVSGKTDAQGHWDVGPVPSQVAQIWTRANHPNYARDEVYRNPAELAGKFYDKSAVLTIHRALTLTGKVTDAAGKPLPGATIIEGWDFHGANKTSTGEDGTFALPRMPSGETFLTFSAKGNAPHLERVAVKKGMAPLAVQLQPGRKLQGKVVDAEGKPIAGAQVAVESWQNRRTLEWSANTDEQGRFEWPDAPHDGIGLRVSHRAYAGASNVPVRAGEQEHTITLYKPAKLTGIVTDAQTGEPIRQFAVQRGIGWQEGQPVNWQSDWGGLSGSDGKFEIQIDDPYPFQAFRVIAEGYYPADSRNFSVKEGDTTLEFKLTKGSSFSGLTKTPDGKPAAEADVLVVAPGQFLQVEEGRFPPHLRRQGQVQQTDQDGKFTLPPQKPPFTLLVLHDSGIVWKLVDAPDSSLEIVLEPWGRIEGNAMSGTKPSAGQMMIAYQNTARPEVRAFYINSRGTADENGKFVIEHVPPGKVMVAKVVQSSSNSQSYRSQTQVTVEAGKALSVQVGGKGRPVVGQVQVPDEVTSEPDWRLVARLESPPPDDLEFSSPELPDEYLDMTDEQRRNWHQDWLKTEEGQAFQKKQVERAQVQHIGVIEINEDRSFRAEEINPGNYILYVDAARGGNGPPAELLARLRHQFTVPEIPGGVSEEPLQLPPLTLDPCPRNPGDPAPDFELTTLDGNAVTLDHFKGKYLLLNFWNGLSPDDAANDRALRDALQHFGDRIAVLGVNTASPSLANLYVRKRQILWPVAAPKTWWQSEMSFRYPLGKMPSVWIFGANGKLVAKDISGPEINSAMEKALGGSQTDAAPE